MKRNMVIVKHQVFGYGGGGFFLFLVPTLESLEAGTIVLCDTHKGPNQLGVCVCDSFKAEPEEMCILFGTNPKKMRMIRKVLKQDDLYLTQSEKIELGIISADEGKPVDKTVDESVDETVDKLTNNNSQHVPDECASAEIEPVAEG